LSLDAVKSVVRPVPALKTMLQGPGVVDWGGDYGRI